jgi:hypothetical protein
MSAPCWIELFTSQPDVTRAFYTDLFGWEFDAPQEEFGGYFNVSKDGHKVAGGMTNDGSAGAPDGWSVYLAVDNAEKVAEAAEANGGAVLVPAMEVMALGSMVVVADPGGAAIGGWQPGEHKGFEILGEPGAANWFELHTRDFDKAVSFYEAVFGASTHRMGDTEDFRYQVLVDGEEQVAGIMDATVFPDDAPLGWSIYFGTADIQASVAQVEELGGSVTIPPEDTPYGWLAACTDPTGIAFKLQQPPEG